MQIPGFIGSSAAGRSVSVDSSRSVNLYLEANEAGGAGKDGEVGCLVVTPGLRLLYTAGSGPNRRLYTASNERVYAVSGSSLYDVTDSPRFLGSLVTSTGRVGMADNGVHLVIVDGQKGYVLTLADGTFAQITDPDFPRASAIGFMDQYVIVNEVGTRRFSWSALSDATDWDGLDFDSKEGAPDELKTLIVDHREIFLFGSQTSEVWFDSGDPFARNPNGFMEHGTSSPDAVEKLDNSVFWPVQDKNGYAMVVRVEGYVPKRISTHAIELLLRNGDLSQATSWVYQDSGHSFYCLNAPGLTSTPVFDAATQLWHERQSSGGRHRAENHAFLNGIHYVGDYENGNIYALTDDEHTDNGEPLKWIRRFPHISNQGQGVPHCALQIDMEVGVGTSTGQGSDPQVVMRFSDDGGKKFGSERWASAGKIGETKKRVKWHRLGWSRDRVYEISGSDPVKTVLIAAFLETA
jgi:hypothetical protein